MPNAGSTASEMAQRLIDDLAGPGLLPAFAKLYSQHTRLMTGESGLGGWREGESEDRLRDALRLVDAAFIGQTSGDDGWGNAMRRAAEILEWLSHPKHGFTDIPIQLLAAAAYQLAGYPARASALLNTPSMKETSSDIVRCLLQADFPTLIHHIASVWERIDLSLMGNIPEAPWGLSEEAEADGTVDAAVPDWIIRETVSSLGVMYAYMRWGDSGRLERSVAKLEAIAGIALHGADPFAWLLCKLCAAVGSLYVEESLRKRLPDLMLAAANEGNDAFERYARMCCINRRTLIWPSQARGIDKLVAGSSFALCTPTGSGKTMVAELAIIEGLFAARPACGSDADEAPAPIVLYLVPSRALAGEVESKLSRVLNRLSGGEVIVTGLYGGTDWGPTDAWLTAEDRTVLICTYEKGEALIRFLGAHFLHRVSLVVIDEAHKVQYDRQDADLIQAENRSLRLEALVMRLMSHLEVTQSRIVALSAVAAGCEATLSSWVTRGSEALPVTTAYRSTRQLVGRLECMTEKRSFEIRYDVMDGSDLKFTEAGEVDTPFIRHPFSDCPSTPYFDKQGAEKRLRPYLFWAALQMARPDENGNRHAILISVMQNISGHAKDLLRLLDNDWESVSMPDFFEPPQSPGKKGVWERCLRSCEDYLGTESVEYRLLQRGVALHHGKMPSLTARLMLEVIEARVVHVVIATSTLSEGVNLPFETVLIPTLRRVKDFVDEREFANLVGRAGRPGFGTEGRTLVLMETEPQRGGVQPPPTRARLAYEKLKDSLKSQAGYACAVSPESPLAALIGLLYSRWQLMNHAGSLPEFYAWLEHTAPVMFDDTDQYDSQLIDTLDTLDGVILPAIVELEEIRPKEMIEIDLEEALKLVWQRSYAYQAARRETELETIFVRRGRAITQHIYPEQAQRRRLYQTSLPPRQGKKLLDIYPGIVEHLKSGWEYAQWDHEQRFEYVSDTIALLSSHPKFETGDTPGKNITWQQILHWWLDKGKSDVQPDADKVEKWQKYVQDNFGYRACWGLGSVVALATQESFAGVSRPLTLQDWATTGLPWIAFWLKELLIWGTLEPVVTFLMAKGLCVTRAESEHAARGYYESLPPDTDNNDAISPISIRDWARRAVGRKRDESQIGPPRRMEVELKRDFTGSAQRHWHVLPHLTDQSLAWIDFAGFLLATSEKPAKWEDKYLHDYDFKLDVDDQVVSASLYL